MPAEAWRPPFGSISGSRISPRHLDFPRVWPSPVFLLLVCVLPATFHVVQAAEFAPVLSAAPSGKTSGIPRLLVTLPGRKQPVPLDHISRVRFPRTDGLSHSVQPLRTLLFRSGDRLSCEQLTLDPAAVTVSFRGNQVRIPVEHVLLIRSCGPYVDARLLPASGTAPSLPESDLPRRPRRTVELTSPLISGRIAVLLQPVKPSHAAPSSAPSPPPRREHRSRNRISHTVEMLRLRLDVEPPARQPKPQTVSWLVIRSVQHGTPDTAPHCQAVLVPPVDQPPILRPSFSQPLALPPDSFRLTILHDARQLLVLLNEQLLAQFLPRQNTGPRIRTLALSDRADDSASPTTQTTFPCTELTVQHRIAAIPTVRPAAGDRSSILLPEGSELYGDITYPSVTPAQQPGLLRLKSAAGQATLNWTGLQAIHPAVLPSSPTALPAITGTVAHITLQQPIDIPGVPPDQFRAAIVGLAETAPHATSSGLLLHHPLLGRIELPLACVREIRPQFHGTLVPLASSPFHLGESVMPAFHSPRPAGTRLAGTFQLAQPPAGTVELRVVQAEVEAAGPQAPPGSPFLAELRRGGLTTRVHINGRLLGTLNSRLRFRSPTDHPAPVVFPVPADLLQSGRNSWHIDQQPDSRNPASFDDCEIGPVWLEIHHPQPPSSSTLEGTPHNSRSDVPARQK